MILVADCSPLIALASCKGLPLLEALFDTVIVPEAVYHEAVVSDKPEAQQLKEYLKVDILPALNDGDSWLTSEPAIDAPIGECSVQR